MNVNRTVKGMVHRFNIRERDELVCERCGWSWLVPAGESAKEVRIMARLHWDEFHGAEAKP